MKLEIDFFGEGNNAFEGWSYREKVAWLGEELAGASTESILEGAFPLFDENGNKVANVKVN